MNAQSLAMGVAGMLFGLLAGWIIGAQYSSDPAPRVQAGAAAEAPTTTAPGGSTARPVDEARVSALTSQAQANPDDAASRAELGNLFFDAERYPDAITWYEQSVKIDPSNVNVSTDLGVAYYYTNQPDRALAQFEHSLSVDPTHTKTLLNQGIVRAFGKQDLTGAETSWEQVISLAPDSLEAQTARQALESLRAAHGSGAASGGTPK
jgi:tetratricopeptide (TPR) repeat protein